MGKKCGRGCPTTTRLEGLVVRWVGSCLGDCIGLGINDGSYGCQNTMKRGDMMRFGPNLAV